MKRQCRMTKETPQHVRVSGQAPSLAADVGLNVVEGVRCEVREAAVLEVAPQQFHRVEVWRVGRKPDDVAARMSGQPLPHERVLVRAPAIQSRTNGPRTWRARWRRKRTTCGPRMFIPGYRANARVICRRRGDTIRAPIPETFSCERARTESRGVVPHGAHVRRSTGSIKKPVSSRQIRWAPRRRSFFYRGPVHPNPLAHPLIIALLGPRLRPLRAEATRTEQSTDVIRDRKSTRLNSSHGYISYAVFCLKEKQQSRSRPSRS